MVGVDEGNDKFPIENEYIVSWRNWDEIICYVFAKMDRFVVMVFAD